MFDVCNAWMRRMFSSMHYISTSFYEFSLKHISFLGFSESLYLHTEVKLHKFNVQAASVLLFSLGQIILENVRLDLPLRTINKGKQFLFQGRSNFFSVIIITPVVRKENFDSRRVILLNAKYF